MGNSLRRNVGFYCFNTMTKEELDQYVKDAVRTAAPAPYGQPDMNLVHSALGLVTEVEELADSADPENTIEELGDIMWYVALALNAAPGQLVESTEPMSYAQLSFEAGINHLRVCVADWADTVKRDIFYCNTDGYGEQPIEAIVRVVATLSHLVGVSLKDICGANIRKLKARYPDKFTTEHAINRNLDAERQALTDE